MSWELYYAVGGVLFFLGATLVAVRFLRHNMTTVDRFSEMYVAASGAAEHLESWSRRQAEHHADVYEPHMIIGLQAAFAGLRRAPVALMHASGVACERAGMFISGEEMEAFKEVELRSSLIQSVHDLAGALRAGDPTDIYLSTGIAQYVMVYQETPIRHAAWRDGVFIDDLREALKALEGSRPGLARSKIQTWHNHWRHPSHASGAERISSAALPLALLATLTILDLYATTAEWVRLRSYRVEQRAMIRALMIGMRVLERRDWRRGMNAMTRIVSVGPRRELAEE